ncbi:unnamed protein product [Caenorhabditis auriculariae]|uniref:Akirin n=1 Tax=Caenorhabditis auriculariae TaxID=2777116 RepID=A0A8S1HE33_9PELO|nr:unnamed protein product [Caenorhabditis auriculariae]
MDFSEKVEMACGLALKRPHEYEAYLKDDGYGPDPKRARTASHCSPFRPQMGTIAANLPSSSTSFSQRSKEDESSPFAVISGQCQLSSSQLDAYLRSEIRCLRRRKILPKRSFQSAAEADTKLVDDPVERKEYRTPSSPTHSASDSDGEGTSNQTQTKKNLLYSKPQFSLKQVQIICERLLKEQEMRLRHEYETALNKKLNEQHEQYVQFASEQLAQQRVDSSHGDYAFSYLS